ncbi:MAG: hypothetical protein AB7Y74_09420 [Syntrophorhabdus sp.]
MILKALATIILDSSDGSIEVRAGEFFRTESSGAIVAGCARELNAEEKKEVLAEFVHYTKSIFRIGSES